MHKVRVLVVVADEIIMIVRPKHCIRIDDENLALAPDKIFFLNRTSCIADLNLFSSFYRLVKSTDSFVQIFLIGLGASVDIDLLSKLLLLIFADQTADFIN